MRIVVNDIAASTGGAMTVLRDFYNAVCKYGGENEWIFLLGDRYFEETDNVKIVILPEIKKSRIKKLVFDFFTGRRFIEKLNPDAVFSLQNIITFGLKVPQTVYIHQSIPFQAVKRFSFLKPSERNLAVIQHLIGKIIKLSAKKSDRIIVQTKWMKDAVCSICGIDEFKVYTAFPSVDSARAAGGESFDRNTFFYPTADEIYKNNDCIYKASGILENKGIDHHITLTLPSERSTDRITCTGRLPYNEVVGRYCTSTLIFPSYMETFGYPLAEARMVGAIVLASDTPFSREVLDGYENAYFFDPFEPQQLADLMEKVALGEIEKLDVADCKCERGDSWAQVIDFVLETIN